MSEENLSKEKDLERFKHGLASELELLRATAAFEHVALKALYLLNGGGLVVFLALYGAITTSARDEVTMAHDLAFSAMVAWVVGLVIAAIATGLSYGSQYGFLKSRRRRLDADKAEEDGESQAAGEKAVEAKCWDQKAKRLRCCATVLWMVSIIAFLLGVALAWFSIETGAS